MLKTFQQERRHMALVVDEYGQLQGIATLEDVLEEIVGEIDDESDIPEEVMQRQPDGSFTLDADMELRRLAAALNVRWDPRVEPHSVNGIITERLGRLPEAGDTIDWQGYEISVTSASERRAEQVTLRRKRKKVSDTQ
jgi:CBS domain containing-hemolysin-like protein